MLLFHPKPILPTPYCRRCRTQVLFPGATINSITVLSEIQIKFDIGPVLYVWTTLVQCFDDDEVVLSAPLEVLFLFCARAGDYYAIFELVGDVQEC